MATNYAPAGDGSGFFQPLTDWLNKSMVTFVEWLKEMAIEVINWCIEALATAMEFALAFLPDFNLDTCTQYFNNFSNTNTAMPKAVQTFNFFFPMDCFIAIVGVWALSEVAYILVAPLLRWLKLVAQ